MKTTKTWKQKTKLVGLAVVVGLTTTFGGIGGLAAPVSAATGEGNVICYGNQDHLAAQKLIVIERALYNHKKCTGMQVWLKETGGSWKSKPYQYAANCDLHLNVPYVADVCGLQEVLTLDDFLSEGKGCFYNSANGNLLKNKCSGKAYEGLTFSES